MIWSPFCGLPENRVATISQRVRESRQAFCISGAQAAIGKALGAILFSVEGLQNPLAQRLDRCGFDWLVECSGEQGVSGLASRVHFTRAGMRPYFTVTFRTAVGSGTRPAELARLWDALREPHTIFPRYLASTYVRAGTCELLGWAVFETEPVVRHAYLLYRHFEATGMGVDGSWGVRSPRSSPHEQFLWIKWHWLQALGINPVACSNGCPARCAA